MKKEVVKYDNDMNTVQFVNFTQVDFDLFMAICSQVKNKEAQQVVLSFDYLMSLIKWNKTIGINRFLDKLLNLRKKYAYGEQVDYFDRPDVIGFVRKGDFEHTNSGLAVVMTDKLGGTINMNVGSEFANTTFINYLDRTHKVVYIDSNGNGDFWCNDGGVSVWVKKS